MEQLGIDARTLVGRGPQVWISITAHGRSESQRHRVGFGDDAAAGGGPVGWVASAPVFITDAVADPVTGLTAALAGVQLLERGGRWIVDVALARVAASTVGGWVESSHVGSVKRPHPRRDPGAAMPLGRDPNRSSGRSIAPELWSTARSSELSDLNCGWLDYLGGMSPMHRCTRREHV
jgi:hypothetical protein